MRQLLFLTPMSESSVRPSEALKHVRYEIRGRAGAARPRARAPGLRDHLAQHRQSRAPSGFRTPETMRLAMIENLPQAEGYCHQKGIFPAREAVVMQQQARGIPDVTAEEVFIGNGVSELIDLTLRALLERRRRSAGAEPRLSAVDRGGDAQPAAARCTTPAVRSMASCPIRRSSTRLITPRTRALVVINPNNPTGAVYPRAVLEALARLAERTRPGRVQRRDLRPDDLRRRRVRADGDAGARHAVRDAVGTLEGVPRLRLPRRLGGVLRTHARARLSIWARSSCSASLRLCSNVPGAVGGADRARRPSEHPRAHRPGRAAVRVARA